MDFCVPENEQDPALAAAVEAVVRPASAVCLLRGGLWHRWSVFATDMGIHLNAAHLQGLNFSVQAPHIQEQDPCLEAYPF